MVLRQLLFNGFVTGCLYAIVAAGLAWIYNVTNVLHLAHGAVYVCAAYTYFVLNVQLGWAQGVSFAGSVLTAALLGLLIELVVYAPLARRRASPTVALLSSLGVYIAIVNALALIFGNQTQVLTSGPTSSITFAGTVMTTSQILQMSTAVGTLATGFLALCFTPLGKTIRAVRDSQMLATVMGINVWAVRAVVFMLGSSFAGMAAIVTARDFGIDPQAGMSPVLAGAVALILGGIGTFEGAVIGGLVLGLIQSLVTWAGSAQWVDGVSYAILFLFLLFRPQGALGVQGRLEERTT